MGRAGEALSRTRVLVVDDEEPFRVLMESELGRLGYAIQCVKSGEEALEALSVQDVEVVLLTASSREALVRTHARYFKSVPELAAALASALPAIPEAAARPISKHKVGTDQQRGSNQREP